MSGEGGKDWTDETSGVLCAVPGEVLEVSLPLARYYIMN